MPFHDSGEQLAILKLALTIIISATSMIIDKGYVLDNCLGLCSINNTIDNKLGLGCAKLRAA